MTKDSYCEINEYGGIPTVEQFVSFLSSTAAYLYLLVHSVLNCYATML